MNAETLRDILDKHAKWRRGKPGGSRADLTGADLTDAYLTGADLTGANLAGANLARADLTGADLTGANLAGADLTGADLTGAYLTDAYLADAYLAGANLAGANLAGANLAGANLTGAYLTDAYLADARNLPAGVTATEPPTPYTRSGPTPATLAERAKAYRERHPDVPVVERLDSRILALVTSGEGQLDMSSWHSEICKTTHCRAGWAITLGGEMGAKLETEHGPERAGRMIYRASTGRVPYFFGSTEAALEDLKRCAAEEVAGG